MHIKYRSTEHLQLYEKCDWSVQLLETENKRNNSCLYSIVYSFIFTITLISTHEDESFFWPLQKGFSKNRKSPTTIDCRKKILQKKIYLLGMT